MTALARTGAQPQLWLAWNSDRSRPHRDALAAIALAQADRTDEAIDAAKRVIKEFPEENCGYLALGHALARAGRMVEALKALDHALEIDPSSVAGLTRAEVLVDLGRIPEALAMYRQALKWATSDLPSESMDLFVERVIVIAQ